MYKKFMLSLMFLPVFSSSESLCWDPVIVFSITTIASNAIVAIINNTGSAINNTCTYFFPSQERIELDAASKVNTVEYNSQLKYFEKKEKYKDCLTKSKPDSDITSHGVPIKCKDLMIAFLLCGGRAESEIIEMTDSFNKYKN